MKYLMLAIALFLLPLDGYAQKPYPQGLLLDDEEYERLPHTSDHIQIDLGQRSISRKVDLLPYCPEIRHQGDIQSCVGWSAGYAALTIERAIKKGWTDRALISENANSALFVYNQLSQGNCNMGISMPEALSFLQEKGNCLARDFDQDVNNCTKTASEALEQKAEQYRIQDFLPLFRKDDPAGEKIRNVKLVVAQQKPVIVGMMILNNFLNIKAGESRWFPGIGDTNYAGGHAMVVVGYDDDRFRRPGQELPAEKVGAFKLMNSWGKNWGENGFIWVSYDHFAEYCRHAYAIMLADAAPIDFNLDTTPEETTSAPDSGTLISMAGSFGFRRFTGQWDNDTPLFEEAGVRLSGDHYILEGAHQTGEAFQLYVKSGFDQGYIYVFSVDAMGKAEIHFPKSPEYEDEFQGNPESALLLNNGSLLTIPSEESALQLTHPGQDHLIVLFSTLKIKPAYLQYLCGELSKSKAQLTDRLLELLSKHRVPLADITFQPTRMGFEVSTRSEGKIVPLVLQVDVNP